MTIRELMGKGGILLAPGIYDALSGLIATKTGAKAVYLSGASLAYTRFGRSDVGLVSVSEVHDTLAAITDRIETPVVVDADNGFGNALNTQRTVRYFERAGAAAIQLPVQAVGDDTLHCLRKAAGEGHWTVGAWELTIFPSFG